MKWIISDLLEKKAIWITDLKFHSIRCVEEYNVQDKGVRGMRVKSKIYPYRLVNKK